MGGLSAALTRPRAVVWHSAWAMVILKNTSGGDVYILLGTGTLIILRVPLSLAFLNIQLSYCPLKIKFQLYAFET